MLTTGLLSSVHLGESAGGEMKALAASLNASTQLLFKPVDLLH